MDLQFQTNTMHNQSPSSASEPKASGVWTAEEHDRFLEGMARFPMGPWSAIAEIVGTRSVRQVHSHAQKYAAKVERHQLGKAKLRRSREPSEPALNASGHRVVPKIPGKLLSRSAAAVTARKKKKEQERATSPVRADLFQQHNESLTFSDSPSSSPHRSDTSSPSPPPSPASVGGFQSLLLGASSMPTQTTHEPFQMAALPSLDESLDYFIYQFGV